MRNKLGGLLIGVVVALLLWATRLWALDLLPLHNDEGLHLTRAVEVWNGHPFWAISDGKIVNHWLIAVFYPQNEPVFVGRMATVFISLIGLTAGYTLARRLAGLTGAVLAALLWMASPYLFFYERLAFSDAEAGSLVVLALLAATWFTRTTHYHHAVITGLAFAAAALFKFTAAPFALSVALVMLLSGKLPARRRLIGLLIIIAVTVACFAVPLAYLQLKERDFFTVALGWIGISASSADQLALGSNLERLWKQLTGFGSIIWVVFLVSGLILTLMRRFKALPALLPDRSRAILLAAGLLPLCIMMVFGREVLSRHYVVTLPLLLTLAGSGIGCGIDRFAHAPLRQLVVIISLLALAAGFIPFALTAYTNPAALPLPAEVQYEHITAHSAGFGLREAVQSFPQMMARRDLQIVGSMFPDGCRRANFYAVNGLTMVCTDAPGIPLIEANLQQRGAVYVLADNTPLIGVDVTTLAAKATRLAAYPRPGETEAGASVVLWLLESASVESPNLTDCSAEAVKAAQASLPTYAPSPLTEFVKLRAGQFVIGEQTFTARGINYYPASFPWRRFLTRADLETVNNELALLRSAGFNTLRLFLWNEALFACPETGASPIPENFARLDAILQSAAGQGFRLLVTLNDLPDLVNASLYTNPPFLIEQTRFIVERYRDEAAILAWDLRNEGDIDYGSNSQLGGKFTREQVLNWLAQTSELVRGLDGTHLITAGWLYDSETTAPFVDFISFHHWEDAARLQARIDGIRAQTDKPILLQEFGYSTFRITPEEQARRLREAAEVAETEKLLGWLIWTAFDFPLAATCVPPACPSQDNAEHHFGLWYADYTPKPAVAALTEFTD